VLLHHRRWRLPPPPLQRRRRRLLLPVLLREALPFRRAAGRHSGVQVAPAHAFGLLLLRLDGHTALVPLELPAKVAQAPVPPSRVRRGREVARCVGALQRLEVARQHRVLTRPPPPPQAGFALFS
jgi:hypothetical protein